MQVLSVAASSSGSVVIPFTPQWLGILPGAAGTVTSVLAKTLGIGVSADLDSTGLSLLGRPRVQAPFVGPNRMWLVPLADGLLKDRTCQVDIVTGAGGTVTVFALAARSGKIPFINGRQTILANTAYTVDKMFQAASDTTGTDSVTLISNPLIEGEPSIVHQIAPSELRALAVMFACYSSGTDWDAAVLDNWNQNFKSLTIQPTAQRTMYFTKAAL